MNEKNEITALKYFILSNDIKSDVAHLDILALLDHQFGLYFLEALDSLGHQGVLEMLQRSLHEDLSHLLAHTGRLYQAIHGFLLHL